LKQADCLNRSNWALASTGLKAKLTPTCATCANRPLEMNGGHNETPARGQAQPGQGGRYADAAGTCKIAQGKVRAKRAGLYHIQPEGGEPFTIEAKGRDAWALDQLREAGPKGCTTIEQPALRWSAYVHNLRGLGVPIETLTEPHGGEFSGTHGRYVLRCEVRKGGAT
jgi:hypothetical protein